VYLSMHMVIAKPKFHTATEYRGMSSGYSKGAERFLIKVKSVRFNNAVQVLNSSSPNTPTPTAALPSPPVLLRFTNLRVLAAES